MDKERMKELIVKLKCEMAMMLKHKDDQTRIIRAQNKDMQAMRYRLGAKDLTIMSLRHQVNILKNALENYKSALADDWDDEGDFKPIAPADIKKFGDSGIYRKGDNWYVKTD